MKNTTKAAAHQNTPLLNKNADRLLLRQVGIEL